MVGMGWPGGTMMAIDHPSKATMLNNMVQMVGGPPGGRGSSPAGPFKVSTDPWMDPVWVDPWVA